MAYLLDTNILIHCIRRSEKGLKVSQEFGLFEPDQVIYISAVSKGEILSFAKQAGWGADKSARLVALLNDLKSIPITGDSDLVNAYADLDAYSQGKHPDFSPPTGFSARNMGKNDLWIASTAFLLDVPLITTDNDFQHLHPNFITVHQV